MWLVVALGAVVVVAGIYVAGGPDALAGAAVDAVAGDDQMDNGGDKAAWAAQFWRALGQAQPQLSSESKLIALAQAALESGWGTAWAATHCFNAFNLTTVPGASNGTLQTNADDEYDANGNSKRIDQWWMVCTSWADNVNQWWAWQSRRAPAAQTALQNGDVYGFISALRVGGYFTLPLDKYLAGMQPILDAAKAMNLG